MRCKHCGKEIKGTVKFCKFCGGAVQIVEVPTEKRSVEDNSSKEQETHLETEVSKCANTKVVMHQGKAVDTDNEGWLYSATLLRNSIGPQNVEYYVSQFKKIKQGEKADFNWAVFFGGPIVPL